MTTYDTDIVSRFTDPLVEAEYNRDVARERATERYEAELADIERIYEFDKRVAVRGALA